MRVKTTPQNVQEANEALFRATMNLPNCRKTLWYDSERNEANFLGIFEV